jgi:hypothetical protein
VLVHIQHKIANTYDVSMYDSSDFHSDVLGGWTSKINNAKNQEQEKKPIPGENMEGVDPSEWD